VEVDAPGLGVAYGTLDSPLRVPVGHRVTLGVTLDPDRQVWDQACRWNLPPGLQWRGWFLPRRYVLERTIAWRWMSRLGDKGRS